MPMFMMPQPRLFAEVFCAIQGEGSLAGVPAVFLIADDAPLRPMWCREQRGKWKPDEGLALGSLVAAVRRCWYDYAVIAGGEPLTLPELDKITDRLRRFDHHVTVETPATVYAEMPCDLMSISIELGTAPAAGKKGKKTSKSGLAHDPKVLRQLVEKYPYQIKFYCNDPAEIPEIKRIVEDCGAKRSNVFLIAGAAKPKDRDAQMEWLNELSRVQGYRLGARV